MARLVGVLVRNHELSSRVTTFDISLEVTFVLRHV